MSLPTRPRVAVLIDPGDSWGRGIIHGISSAIRQGLSWELLIAPRDEQMRFRIPARWNGNGIIAAVRDEWTARHLCAFNLPTVNVSSWERSRSQWFIVRTDDQRRAEMAFQHFRERGFQHFAYYGPRSPRYSASRGELFRDVVMSAGFCCELFPISSRNLSWQSIQSHTLRWLQQLPRPLAVFVADPVPGVHLTEICNLAGLKVPEEIAILVGDTDDLLCEISDPPLSSIVLASEQIGAVSVRTLDLLMNGQAPASRLELIPPMRIVGRQSSDILAIADPVLVEALRLIRQLAHTGIQVKDLLRNIPVSRRSLEYRFQHQLNCTPADEIRRVRLERVKLLLTVTDQTTEQIAHASGFCSPSQLCFAFKKETGQTPQEYRRISQSGGQMTALE